MKRVRYWIEWLLVSFFGRLVPTLPLRLWQKNRGRGRNTGFLGRLEGPGGGSREP